MLSSSLCHTISSDGSCVSYLPRLYVLNTWMLQLQQVYFPRPPPSCSARAIKYESKGQSLVHSYSHPTLVPSIAFANSPSIREGIAPTYLQVRVAYAYDESNIIFSEKKCLFQTILMSYILSSHTKTWLIEVQFHFFVVRQFLHFTLETLDSIYFHLWNDHAKNLLFKQRRNEG